MFEAEQKIRKARAGLILDQPFFGALALRLQLKADPGCKTAWTDGQVLGYDPSYIKEISLDEIKGLWAEEVLHNGLCHHTRRGDRDPKQWNLAADQAIFHILKSSGFALPDDCQPDPRFKDRSAEDIYTMMGQDKKPDPAGKPDAGGSQDPQGTPGQGPGQGPQEQKPGRQPGQGRGDVRDATGDQGQAMGPQDLAQEEQNQKVAMSQAAQQAKACGNLPGDLVRLVQDLVHPKLNPYDILRQFLEMSARNDYSWCPPNRRYLGQGFYLPSLRSEELPAVVVAVDTSGSVDQAELDQFAAEISGILEAYDTNVTVIFCDSGINGDPETFTREDLPLTLKARGGGGTDFRPPFKWVQDQELEPACLIYLTDMDCRRYPVDPGYPVLWAKIGTWPTQPPPFGDVIEID